MARAVTALGHVARAVLRSDDALEPRPGYSIAESCAAVLDIVPVRARVVAGLKNVALALMRADIARGRVARCIARDAECWRRARILRNEAQMIGRACLERGAVARR